MVIFHSYVSLPKGIHFVLGVSINGGTPKWIENSIKIDDLGVPLFQETTICGWNSGLLTYLVQWENEVAHSQRDNHYPSSMFWSI